MLKGCVSDMVNFNCALTIEYNGRTKINSKSLLESTYRTCILYIAPNLPCVEHAYIYMYESCIHCNLDKQLKGPVMYSLRIFQG